MGMYPIGSYVYKYVYNNEIIYIGKNDTNLENRIKQHTSEPKFKPYLNSVEIFYARCANKIMSDVIESALINKYRPKLNVAKMTDWGGLNIIEPTWIRFQFIPKKVNHSGARKAIGAVLSHKRKDMLIEIKRYKMMFTHYCPEMLKNILFMTEDDSTYSIKVPLGKDDINYEYFIPLCIFGREKDGKGFGYSTIAHTHWEKDSQDIYYIFNKEYIFEDFLDVPIGLIPRIENAMNLYKHEYMEKCDEYLGRYGRLSISELEYVFRNRKNFDIYKIKKEIDGLFEI